MGGSGILDFIGIPAAGRPKLAEDPTPGILEPPKAGLLKPLPIPGPGRHGPAGALGCGWRVDSYSSGSCTAVPSAGGFDLELEDCKNRRWVCEVGPIAPSRCQQKAHTDGADASYID